MRLLLVPAILAFSSIATAQNRPPPTPPLMYPDGTEAVHTAQPTIILESIDDPDGDPVNYFLEVDFNPCFCSAEHQASGPLPEGDLVTQWMLPRPLLAGLQEGRHCRFYIQRWASDGMVDSVREFTPFNVDEPDGSCGERDGGAEVDTDGDADEDADLDGDTDGGVPHYVTYGCSVAGGDGGAGPAALAGLVLLLILVRRRRAAAR